MPSEFWRPVTGPFLPSRLLLYYSNLNCLACQDTLPVGQSHDVLVGPGPQVVSLVAPGCLVQEPSTVQATAGEGAVLEIGFAVRCAYSGVVAVIVSTEGVNVDESFWLEGSVVGSAYDGYYLGLDRQPLDTTYFNTPYFIGLPAGQAYSFLLSDIAANCRVIGDNPATVLVQAEVYSLLNFNVRCE